MGEERLQKIIAASGRCSRRKAEELIREGRVTVNGRPAELGQKADPERDHVKVDGRMLRLEQTTRYLLLYKPREVMTTCDDPEGRRTVLHLLGRDVPERVFPVGRLDYHSEGLLLLTNDGEFAERVTHPRHGVVREYLVRIRGDLDPAELRKLMRGTSIEGRVVRPLDARRERLTKDGANSWWRVSVTEGRTHEVRELFFRAGHHVQRLRRVAIGPLTDSVLKPGQYRDLSEAEVKAVLRAARSPVEVRPSARQAGTASRTGSRSGQQAAGERPARDPRGGKREGRQRRNGRGEGSRGGRAEERPASTRERGRGPQRTKK